MPLFSFRSRSQLSPAWTYTPGGLLWRLLPTPSGRFVGESRDADELQVRFFHLNAVSGSVVWEDRTWAEPWWTGLEAVHRDVVLLHEYAKPDLPGHARMHSVDLEGGTLLWSAADLTFSFAFGDRIYATRSGFDERTVVALELRSGSVADEYGGDLQPVHELRALAEGERREDLLQFPEPSETDDANPDGESSTELIRGTAWTVVGTYEPLSGSKPPAFRQRLTILDNRSRPVFREVIHDEARARVPDTFFVWKGMLYFLKNQRTLTAVVLPRESKQKESFGK